MKDPSETSEDKAFRKHMGEIECPHCGLLLMDDDIEKIEDELICVNCGGIVNEQTYTRV